MRVMIDTNVLFSAFIIPSPLLMRMIDVIAEQHTIVLSSYVIDELKRVTRKKFPDKYGSLESFLKELPFELVYTPEKIDKQKYPRIRDEKDLPVLITAIIGDVDVLVSGDEDFKSVETERPEFLTPRAFVEKYCE